MTWFVKSTLLSVELASRGTPTCDEPGEPPVLLVVEWELVSSKAIEPVGHFGEKAYPSDRTDHNLVWSKVW